MDIGVLTLYKVRNIGACLQAVAMKRTLESYGNRVFFIEGYNEDFAKQLYKNDMGKIRPWSIAFRMQKNHKFLTFFSHYSEIGIEKVCELDGVIVGSDSVWYPDYGKLPMPAVFFGDVDCKTVCSYAPSVGGKYDLRKYTPKQLTALKRFSYITVRDNMSQLFVKQTTGKDSTIVADPTLLCDWKDYLGLDMRTIDEKYIMVYGGIDRRTAEAIKKYAKKKGLKVINVGSFNRFFKRNIAVSPIEFLQYIQNASYVITSMFHGAMLSVALGKEFRYISMDKNRDIKLSTTMERLKLTRVMLNRQDVLGQEDIFETPIDYQQISQRLAKFRGESHEEIKKILAVIGRK